MSLGGFTGAGKSKYEIAGTVYRGEYVVPLNKVRAGGPFRIKRRNIVKMMLLGFWKPHLWKWFFSRGWRFFR